MPIFLVYIHEFAEPFALKHLGRSYFIPIDTEYKTQAYTIL